MSNYSQALTVIGGAIGAYVTYGSPAGWQAGASFGAALGGTAGAAIDISKQRIEGPRLTDARTITAEYGDVIPWVAGAARVGGQVWWVSDRREVGTTTEEGKGGGPKNTTYTYEQDILLGLTSEVMGDVARIWSNGKLVWTQMPGADIESIVNSQESPLWSRLTIYTGEAGQLPDPTYEAAVGAGNAPAYRGRCSVMIEGLQLGTSGQMPNLTFEVVKNGLQTVFLDAPMTSNGLDTVAPAATTSASTPPTYTAEGGYFTRTPGDPKSISFVTPSGGKLDIAALGKRGVWNLQAEFSFSQSAVAGTGDNIRFFFTASSQFGFSYQRVSGSVGLYAWVNESFGSPTQIDLGRPLDSGKYRIVFDTSGDPSAWNVKWYVNNELLHTRVTSAVGFTNIFIGFASGSGGGVDAMTVSKFKVTAAGVGEVELGEPLQGVVEQLCDRAGMPSGTYDASALSTITKPVRSLLLAQLGAARAALQPLQLAYHFDCTLTDKLYFRPRATSAVATIPLDDLAAGVDKPSGEPFALTQGSDIELPAQVAVRYRNVENDYQTGVEVSDRLLSGQVAMQPIEVALGMTPSEAKALADVMVNDNLAALTRGTISLSMAYAHLQPADVVLIDGETMRLGRKQDARGVITFETRRHDASTILSAGVTDSTGYESASEVTAPTATVLQVLDVPILRDADNGPGHYVAANGGATWAGASVQRSINNVDFSQAATVLERAVFGTCTTTLGNFAGIGFDEVNSVSVSVGTGELASSTRDALLLDQQVNVILIGGEVIRFVTATLTGTAPNRYKLTRLLRGQRGTEWAMASHVADERCVLLRPQGLRYIATPQADIGATRYIKGVTNGLNASTATGAAYVNTGVGQKPFSPANLRASRVSAGTYALTWQRRTRLQTTFADGRGVIVPLGESAEAYEVDTFDSSNVLIRTTTADTESATIGGPGKEKTYAAGVLYPVTYSSKVYGVAYFGNLPAGQSKVHRFASDGTIEASTAAIPGTVWSATNNGSGAYYVLTTETGPDGFINACKLRRINLSTLAVTATVDLYALYSQVGYSITWDGTSVWSATIAGATLRKHDATSLSVSDTEILTNTATAPIKLSSNGAGTVFAAGKDWTKVVSFDSASSGVNWTVDYAAQATQVQGVEYIGSKLFISGSSVIVANPANGAVDHTYSRSIIGDIVNFDGNAAYASAQINPLTGLTLSVPGPCYVLDGTTGTETTSFPLESDLVRLSGTVDSKLLAVSVNQGAGNPYLGHLYGPAPDLPGGRVVVYQMSSIVGRGYPAEITL